MAATDITWDYRALDIMVARVSAELLPPLASEVADYARAICPVRVRRTPVPVWAKRGHVGTPGRLKASVQYSVDTDYIGPYADIAALWYGRFLDPPAKQMHRLHPFLPTALITVVSGKEYHL